MLIVINIYLQQKYSTYITVLELNYRRAPVTGLYTFTIFHQTNGDNNVDLQLRVNGNMNCKSDATSDWNTGNYLFSEYRSGTVNSKSFVGKVFLRIKWKFELIYAL